MNKKGLMGLVCIFCFIYFLNVMTPLINDDYFAAFVWSEGVPINGFMPGEAQRIIGFSDIFKSLKAYYFTWGGRLPGASPVSFFVWQGKNWFNPINALMFIFLIMGIYWLSHEGTISLDFNLSYVMGIFFSLWTFNCSFVDTCLWLSGSCNYLWMTVIIIVFLIPYVKNYFNSDSLSNSSYIFSAGVFLLGVLAGWSHETTTCWLLIVMCSYLFFCQKRHNLQLWKVTGFVGLIIGYGLLILSPGNFSRLSLQTGASDAFLFPNSFKFNEFMLILSFHLLLYYYIIKVNYKCKSLSEQLLEKVKPYLCFSIACLFISISSSILMLFIPSSGLRPSYLSLVYLVVAASLLVRAQEKTGISMLKEHVKSLLIVLGCFYMTLTISISLYCNLLNWLHWNDVLALVKAEQMNPSGNIITVEPYFTHKNFLMWLAGSGFHLIYMPLTADETGGMNISFSRYYGIKGIRVTKKTNPSF